MSAKLESLKVDIQEKGLNKISQYFDLQPDKLAEMDEDSLKHLYNMAKLGMQFEKEMNLSKRATELNYVRIGRIVSENKEEMKKYLKKSLPNYF